MIDFKNKKIAVVGEGVEGESSAKYLKEKGAEVTISDEKQRKDYLGGLDKYDLVVRSPGVKISTLEKALEKFGKAGSGSKGKSPEITSQIKLFFDLCPAEIIGITGTKGKGTTASLIYEMLKKQGIDAYLGGNIGVPPFDFLDKLNAQSKVVLELSSFQLVDLKKSPHIAVMLMITSEHLNYHKNLEEYIDAKRNLIKFQNESDVAILNRDYPAANESDMHTLGKVFQVSREQKVANEGCFVRDGKVIIRVGRLSHTAQDARQIQSQSSKDTRSLSENRQSSSGRSSNDIAPIFSSFADEKSSGPEEIEIIDTTEILLPGKHNWENTCAAAMTAYLAGVSVENIAWVLKTFKGLEHRLELIATINGVRYYDDSFSTTPETAIAAIEAFKEPEILILGGSSKNSDFKELGGVIAKAGNIGTIIGIGVEWERIKAQIPASETPIPVIEGAKDMQTIVAAAHKLAVPGDVVLLTPACASFDMFKNYKDRGEQFKEQVALLQL